MLDTPDLKVYSRQKSNHIWPILNDEVDGSCLHYEAYTLPRVKYVFWRTLFYRDLSHHAPPTVITLKLLQRTRLEFVVVQHKLLVVRESRANSSKHNPLNVFDADAWAQKIIWVFIVQGLQVGSKPDFDLLVSFIGVIVLYAINPAVPQILIGLMLFQEPILAPFEIVVTRVLDEQRLIQLVVRVLRSHRGAFMLFEAVVRVVLMLAHKRLIASIAFVRVHRLFWVVAKRVIAF